MERYSIKKGYIIQKTKGKTVIFDGEESLIITLNETGSLIFDELKKRSNVTQIAEKISKKYDIDETKAINDTKEFIKELLEKQILSTKK